MSDNTSNSVDVLEKILERISDDKFEICFYIFILVWAIYMYIELQTYNLVQDYLFPSIILLSIISLTIIKLVILVIPIYELIYRREGQLFQAKSNFNIEEAGVDLPKNIGINELIAVFWVCLLLISIWVFGMGWTAILYPQVFIYYYLRDYKIAIGTMLLILALIFVVFGIIMGISLYDGILGLYDPLQYINERLNELS